MIKLLYSFLCTGDDFSSLVSVAKFSVGQSNTSVCIPIRDDCLKEGNETFSVLLNVPNNTALIPGQLVMATITILGWLTIRIHACIHRNLFAVDSCTSLKLCVKLPSNRTL